MRDMFYSIFQNRLKAVGFFTAVFCTLFVITSEYGVVFAVNSVQQGQCDSLEDDPVTGKKMLFCCLDEIELFQQEGLFAEMDKFIADIKKTLEMNSDEALRFYTSPYDSSLHRKYGGLYPGKFNSPCGEQIECQYCLSSYREPEFVSLVCGDGVVHFQEECDDGNLINGDGCSDLCKIEQIAGQVFMPVCGDTKVEGDEECDDGNLDNGDGCDFLCQTEIVQVSSNGTEEADIPDMSANLLVQEDSQLQPVNRQPLCGNGLLETGEGCDDGNNRDFDGCSALCRLEKQLHGAAAGRCGDGRLNTGEECDYGVLNADAPDSCRTNCKMPRCGDKIIDRDQREQCDDGNKIKGDGCSDKCFIEGLSLVKLPLAKTLASTGPAALAIIISGAAVGWSYMRKKKM